MNSPFLPLGKGEVGHFTDIIRRIYHEYESEGPYSREIIRNYLQILFLKARQHYPNAADQQLMAEAVTVRFLRSSSSWYKTTMQS